MEDDEIKIKLHYQGEEKILDGELNSFNDLQKAFLQLFNPEDQSLDKYKFQYKLQGYDVNINEENDFSMIIDDIKETENPIIYAIYIENNTSFTINQSIEEFHNSAISIDNDINISNNNIIEEDGNNVNSSTFYFKASESYQALISKINDIKLKLEGIKKKKEENINYEELIQILSINLSLIENELNEANDNEKLKANEYDKIKDSIQKLKNDIHLYKQKNMDLIIRLFTKELKKVTDDSESFKKSFLEIIDKLNIMTNNKSNNNEINEKKKIEEIEYNKIKN